MCNIPPQKSLRDFPGVDTAYRLFIKKQGVSHSCHSFCFTQWILLSTIRQADGFETTDCLECLQILDILIYGRRVCFRIWSSREENVLHTSVNQLLYSCRHQSSAYSFFLITVFYVPPTCSTYLLCFSLSQQRRIYQNDGYMRLLLVTCTLNSQIYF